MADEALATFVQKWRERQPEMALLEPFCPLPQRRLFEVWGTLQNELLGAMFDTSDANVARTKLAWWGDDLAAGRAGARHPVARALLAIAEPAGAERWRQLITAAVALGDAARDGATAADAAATRYAERLATIEAALFDAPSDPAAVRTAIALELLLRGGEPQAAAERAAHALAAAPQRPRINLYRSGRLAFDRWYLARLARGRIVGTVPRPPAWHGLWLAWNAARRSRR